MKKSDIINAYLRIRKLDNTIPDEVLDFMKDAALTLLPQDRSDLKNLPYLKDKVVTTERKYNSEYGDDRECECGHSYYRHFDPYEDMEAVGCKYCECLCFSEKKIS